MANFDVQDNHFLQIWAKPDVSGLSPSYVTRNYPDELKKNALVRIMESVSRAKPEAKGEHDPIPLNADLSMDASILDPQKSVTHTLVAEGDRKLYAHVVMTGKNTPSDGGAQIKIGDTILKEGDGAFIEGAKEKVEIESVGDKPAEFLLFDMGEK
jgi:redox-sensitive bicupin YhaK (pirin superfamily)